jgi:AcrR family transcriptional regulator
MAVPPRTLVPGARPARQERSRRAAEAIARAARSLLADRQFDELSVAEVARAAGTSVGGFYARYAHKSALLEVLHATVLDEMRTAFDDALSAVDTPTHGAHAAIHAYVATMVTQFRQHRREILQIRQHARVDRTGDHGRRVAEFNAHVHGRVRALLRARSTEIGHPDPAFAIDFGLFTASAAAREAVLAGSVAAYPIEVDDERLIREIARTWASYLGMPVEA